MAHLSLSGEGGEEALAEATEGIEGPASATALGMATSACTVSKAVAPADEDPVPNPVRGGGGGPDDDDDDDDPPTRGGEGETQSSTASSEAQTRLLPQGLDEFELEYECAGGCGR